MSYELTVEEHPTYLCIVGSGERTEENVRRFLIEADQMAVSRGKTELILLELRFAGPNLNLGAAYSIVSDRIADAKKFKRIAYVDANYQLSPDAIDFAELAAKKQGVNVRVLQNVDDARRWLNEPC